MTPDQAHAAMPLTDVQIRVLKNSNFGEMQCVIDSLLATIEAVKRQHANAIAFKDRVNKALQDKVENETKLKAERDAAQREAKEARELVENWKGTAAAEAGAFREERDRAEHAEAELSAARGRLEVVTEFGWLIERGGKW